jgi:hypothetical protein
MSDSKILGGSPHLCQLKTVSVGPFETSIDYVLMHAGFMGSRKLSSFHGRRVGRYIISPIVMYTEIVYGPPTDSPKCSIVWKTCTRERWDLTRLLERCHELWPLVMPSWLTCVVLSDFLLHGVY